MNSIILPDSIRNSISDKDILKGTFRITTSSKYLFQNCPNKVIVEIKTLRFEGSYSARVGASDTLSIGKIAMQNLNLKMGNSVRITKVANHTFRIERI